MFGPSYSAGRFFERMEIATERFTPPCRALFENFYKNVRVAFVISKLRSYFY